MKPIIFSYPGGKGSQPWLQTLMPESGNLFVDACAGLGNVFFQTAEPNPNRFDKWWVNDIQKAPFFEKILTHGDTLQALEPQDIRHYYDRVKNRPRTIRSILLEPYVSPRGGYNLGGATTRPTPRRLYEERMRRAQAVLRQTNVRITGWDWRDMGLERLGADDFVFFDIPYYEADVRAYKGWTLTQHLELVRFLCGASFRWMFTESPQDFYTQAFGRPVFQKEVHVSLANDGRKRTECVWVNY